MATRKEIGEMLDRERQVGGDHYRNYGIQPIEYIVANSIGFLAGNVIKYVTRYKDKNGAEDIRKAIHYLELILEFEYPPAKQPALEAAPVGPAGTPGVLGPHCPGARGIAGPELILKLESNDPDQVGESDERIRADQKRGHASGPGQVAFSAYNPVGHQKGSG